MKRFLRRLIYSLLLIAAGGVLVAVLILDASVPQLDGEVSVTSISARVTIERDSIGVPTVTAENRADLAFGTGFVHGQDRFFQMDLSRRQAAGELAEIIGQALFEIDKRNRLHRFRSRASRVVAQMSAEETEIMNAFGSQISVATYWCRPCRSPFEIMKRVVPPKPRVNQAAEVTDAPGADA